MSQPTSPSSRGSRATGVNYRDYIRSPEWRAKRQKYWESRLPNNCHVCAAPKRSGFHLHHRTYKNLGNERLMDLVPLCPDCHRLVHQTYNSDPKWRRKGMWYATRHVRKQFRGK